MIRGIAAMMAASLLTGMRAAGETPVVLAAGTTVDFEFVDTLNSKASKAGDTFAIRLSKPVMVVGAIIIPKDAVGQGEVVHAARYIEHDGRRIPLRSLRYGKSGENNTAAATVLAIAAGPLAYLVVGGEVNVPPGTAANAKIAGDIQWLADAAVTASTITEEGEKE